MITSIVVGTDGSDTARLAVQEAADLARGMGATIELVSAYAPISAARMREERRDLPGDLHHRIQPYEDVQALLDEIKETLEDAGVPKVNVYAREGDPADAIIDVAEERDSDLIVVGNKGMTGAKRFFLGAVPNKVSHHAPCSVLIVRTT